MKFCCMLKSAHIGPNILSRQHKSVVKKGIYDARSLLSMFVARSYDDVARIRISRSTTNTHVHEPFLSGVAAVPTT